MIAELGQRMFRMNLEHVFMPGNREVLTKYEKHMGVCLKGLSLAECGTA